MRCAVSDQRSLVPSVLPPEDGPVTSQKCQSTVLHYCSPSDSGRRYLGGKRGRQVNLAAFCGPVPS